MRGIVSAVCSGGSIGNNSSYCSFYMRSYFISKPSSSLDILYYIRYKKDLFLNIKDLKSIIKKKKKKHANDQIPI